MSTEFVCQFEIISETYIRFHDFRNNVPIEFCNRVGGGEEKGLFVVTQTYHGQWTYGLIDFTLNIGNRQYDVTLIKYKTGVCKFDGTRITWPVSNYAKNGSVEYDGTNLVMKITFQGKETVFA